MATELRKISLAQMSGCLAYRGPDGHGFYTDDTVGLAHTRLSIIDLSQQGSQPLYNEDRSLVLICNGEIYNYREIQSSLLQKGHRFFSNSDCEVILHLYEEHPDDFEKVLSRLTGMFAFALWDIKREKLFVARDRIGIKPLYYYRNNSVFAFGSDVAAVTQAVGGTVNIDETSLYEYFLLRSIPGPNTLYKEIKALPAGNYIELNRAVFSICTYWDIPQNGLQTSTESELFEEAETLFSEIIKDHLVADVLVGTFLSAGVDSSLITAVAATYHAGIHSFTASFPGEPEDEGKIAAETAAKLGTTHHSYQLTGDLFKDFEYHFQHIDQPFAITSALSLAHICKMAQPEIKVALSGDGADELFAGYPRHERYWQPRFLRKIPERHQTSVISTVAKITRRKSLLQLSDNLRLTNGEKFLSRIQRIPPSIVASLLSETIMNQVDTRRYINVLDQHFDNRQDPDEINRMLYVDMKTTLVDEMLTKCDRMTMRHGIEGRVPFLDHRFVEFAFSIPSVYKRKDGVGKLMLRKMLAKKLGNDLAYRKKTGFNSPLRQWLQKNEETRNYASGKISTIDSDYFNSKAFDVLKKDIGSADPNIVFYLVSLKNFLQK